MTWIESSLLLTRDLTDSANALRKALMVVRLLARYDFRVVINPLVYGMAIGMTCNPSFSARLANSGAAGAASIFPAASIESRAEEPPDENQLDIFIRIQAFARKQELQEQMAFVQQAARREFFALEVFHRLDFFAADEIVRRGVVPRAQSDNVSALLADKKQLRRRSAEELGAAADQRVDVDPAVRNDDHPDVHAIFREDSLGDADMKGIALVWLAGTPTLMMV